MTLVTMVTTTIMMMVVMLTVSMMTIIAVLMKTTMPKAVDKSKRTITRLSSCPLPTAKKGRKGGRFLRYG